MSELERILAEHLGCWQTSNDRCGEHTSIDHRTPWPCDRLTAAVAAVEEYVDAQTAEAAR